MSKSNPIRFILEEIRLKSNFNYHYDSNSHFKNDQFNEFSFKKINVEFSHVWSNYESFYFKTNIVFNLFF
jgi:hypothetical protein